MHDAATRLKDCAIDRSADGSGELLHGGVAAIARAALGDDPASGPDGPATRRDQARVLRAIVDRHGREALLRAGARLDAASGDPIVLALLNSDAPDVLLDKVARLNRYLHSSHRHRVVHLAEHEVELEHVAVRGAPPTAEESLFVCGLYLELLARIGCGDLTCAFPSASTGPADVYAAGHPHDVPGRGTSRWRIGWSSFQPVRVLPGLDEALLRHPPRDLSADPTAALAAAVVAGDLARSWKVGAVAERLAMSPRTLQRRLTAEGRSFTDVVREARVDAAQDLLRDPGRSVTEIGFLTGFSDTAHLSRTFKAATGATPTEWRARTR
ncbi:MAG: helix-turn-helix transcriptional regulator [Acidimicrobiales bacterium]|nr:helix-turn-helix transcriptional regulator [Acidimicrobiales bacterium]